MTGLRGAVRERVFRDVEPEGGFLPLTPGVNELRDSAVVERLEELLSGHSPKYRPGHGLVTSARFDRPEPAYRDPDDLFGDLEIIKFAVDHAQQVFAYYVYEPGIFAGHCASIDAVGNASILFPGGEFPLLNEMLSACEKRASMRAVEENSHGERRTG